MKYKTHGMSSPQGKAGVYFSCHPNDFTFYFESISDEILKTQNCAIWYTPPNEPLSQDWRMELGQMQLFVMPVTTKLLTTPNRVLDEEFPFATQTPGNQIPVLPIMMERELDELFSQKCGDLQFLDRTGSDSTAISYEEKLEKYLSSVLVGDELAAKVRAAFDAYVFLSYRKKDRQYAQELMRLIHQNNFCRDVAIWYDEYLTPGENFNEAIEKMLKKSDLFALAVTPALLENPNYVLTEEYPAAQKAKKPILPVEMGRTDMDALNRVYDGIPNCIHKGDMESLSSALTDSLCHIALRVNDADPQHNFFIGLAYLNGIDVEVDRVQAKELITSAADASLPEAMEKLVDMYRTGTGVDRDYREAIRWQEKLIDLRRMRYEQSKSEESSYALIHELWRLGDFKQELGNIAGAKAAYQQMLDISFEDSSRIGTVEVRRYLPISYNNLGNICLAEGNLTQAKGYYKKSLEFYCQYAKETQIAKDRGNLAVTYSYLGNIFVAEGNLSQAKEYYTKALDISCRLAEEIRTTQAKRNLSGDYSSLGNIFQAEGNLSKAKEYYEKTLKLSAQLAEEDGAVETRRNLSVSYHKLGYIFQIEGDFFQAKEYYEKSLSLDLQLVEEAGTVQAQQDLSISYERLGGLFQAMGNFHQAKEYYEKVLDIRYRLAEETGTTQANDALAASLYNAAIIIKGQTRHTLLMLAHELWDTLSKENPENPTFQQRLAMVQELLDS